MNVESKVVEAETAAPRKTDKQYGSPMEFVRKDFNRIVINAHPMFRMLILGSLLNNKTFDAFETTNIAGVLGFDLSSYTEPVSGARLRETMLVAPGNGSNKPISVGFQEQFYNIKDDIIADFMKTLPKEVQKGMSFAKFYDYIENNGLSDSIGAQLTPAWITFKEKFVDALDDFVDFEIRITRSDFNVDNSAGSIDFSLAINVEGTAYKDIVIANEFSPYLVYLWVNNSLKVTNRVERIYDPRLASAHQIAMQKFGVIRPKVNKMGFGIWGNGQPIWLPPSLDDSAAFVKTANGCLNEDGVFDRSMLVDDHGYGNKIVYVDWVNDIMAYTTSTGILQSINLGDVSPFDPATEYNYLSTPLSSDAFVQVMRVMTNSLAELDDVIEAQKYTTDPAVKATIQAFSPAQLYEAVRTNGHNPTLMHVAGGQLTTDYDATDDKDILSKIRALKCLFQLLNARRKKDPTSLKIPTNEQSQGILYRIVGIEYVLQIMDKYNDQIVEVLRKDWASENSKNQINRRQEEFDIPNIHIGGGFNGVLPHQGRILSSTSQTPRQMILPVQTGGGKTIIAAVTAIFGIKNLRILPMIMTKGNLLKGMLTEINLITQGKINVVPLTPLVLRRMKRRGGIKTFKQFLNWYRALPPNTILVSSYSSLASRRRIYEDLNLVHGFGDAPIFTTQFLLIIKILGIRMIIGDESHMIKNPESARSRNSYAVFSHADSRGIASGTIVSNTVKDLVGQTRAISPYIFGDDPKKFADRYGISEGLIKSDDDAKIIKDRLRSTVAYHEATREDWSFMLPIKFDEILFAKMTEKQKEFYDILMQEAQLILLELEKSKGKKAKKALAAAEADDDDDDDEDDDEEDEDEDEDDEDAEENAFIAKARTYLQKVEAFLVAPDENEQYMAWEKKPDGEDLVSPKVRLGDQIIAAHLAAHKDDLSTNKVIVFGWNKVASKHFVKHSKYGSQALHYTAGDEAVTLQFTDNPQAWLMIADENSVREGHNWQMSSLILRQQSVWSPGDHEQAVARMYRPDPRGKYNRETVRHVWLMCEGPKNELTLDGVKMARLTSKFVSNARLTYEHRSEWRMVSNEFDDLDMLKMNLDTIFNTNKEDMLPYFGAWKTFVDWENKINVAAKVQLAQDLEREQRMNGNNIDLIDKNGKIIDINTFIKLAMSTVTSTSDIPGSKKVFVPWVPNSIPPDPKGWGFTVMGQQQVPVGAAVYTEFGPAIITAITKRGVKVRIFNGQLLGLKKGDVMLVSPQKYKKFAAMLKDPTKWREEALHPDGVKNVKRVVKEEEMEDDEEVIDDLDDAKGGKTTEEEELEEIEVFATVLNGWPALVIDEDIEGLKKIEGWNRVDPFTSVTFRNWDSVQKFIDLLDTKANIPDKVHDALVTEMNDIKEGKAMKLGKQINMQGFRNFFNTQHKTLGKAKNGKVNVHPYWIVNETDVKLAFDTGSHASAFISWLSKVKTKIPGLIKVTNNDAMWINVFNSVSEAIKDIENLKQLADIDEHTLRDDLADVKKEIMLLRKPRARPKM